MSNAFISPLNRKSAELKHYYFKQSENNKMRTGKFLLVILIAAAVGLYVGLIASQLAGVFDSMLVGKLWIASVMFFVPIMYGYNLAYWQRNWPEIADMTLQHDKESSAILSVLSAGLWPIFIVVDYFSQEKMKYGFLWK